jgi:hypothetical protein
VLTALELKKALVDIPLSSEVGLWTRAVRYELLQKSPPGLPKGGGPQPLWPGGAAIAGARFTPKGGFGSLYLASDAITALREVSAVFGTQTIRTPPWTVFAVEGFLQRILDLTDEKVLDLLETTRSELTGDWLLGQDLYQQGKGLLPPTQLLATVAYETGKIVAMRYHAAKNIQTGLNWVVFADRLLPDQPSFLKVYDPSELLRQRFPP